MALSIKGASAPFYLGVCLPHLRDEALLARALEALQSGFLGEALLGAESVCRRMPRSSLPAVLRAKILAQVQPALAAKAWYAAWCRDPLDPTLQDAVLQAFWEAGAHALVRTLALAFLPARCRHGEYGALVHMLGRVHALPMGACWRDGSSLRVRVFGGDPHAKGMMLQVSDGAKQWSCEVPADGTSLAIPVPSPQGVWSLALAATHAGVPDQLLAGSPVSFVDPVAAAEVGGVDRGEPSTQAVHIVIPVYRNLALVRACLGSVLASRGHNTTPLRVTVVDDASGDEDVAEYLEGMAAQGHINLLRNTYNLGFIESCNRGMRLHPGCDCLLLNADTQVCGDWVDRMRAALYADPTIASVTPWSNNGEVSSFPCIASAAPQPAFEELMRMDDTCARLHRNGTLQDMDIPSGCGFALLMRGAVLQTVGLLDGAGLTRGYNEEVDWCMRARAAGYRHRLASGVFVAHAGTASFGYEKVVRVAQNRKVVMARYPDYYPQYHRFVRADPLAPLRRSLSQALQPVCPQWLDRAERMRRRHNTLASLVPPALAGACRRIAVWPYDPAMSSASQILALARRVASLPAPVPTVRLLVFGTVPEALWRTGVVDAMPSAPEVDAGLLGNSALLGWSGCTIVLSENEDTVAGSLPVVVLDAAFEPKDWLKQWLSQSVQVS